MAYEYHINVAGGSRSTLLAALKALPGAQASDDPDAFELRLPNSSKADASVVIGERTMYFVASEAAGADLLNGLAAELAARRCVVGIEEL
jgi:hypothetical protein